MTVITLQLLESGLCKGIGLNQDQALCLGIPWPLVTGWKERILGRVAREEDVANFMRLKGIPKKRRHSKRGKTEETLFLREMRSNARDRWITSVQDKLGTQPVTEQTWQQ